MKDIYVLDTLDIIDDDRCIMICDKQDFDFEFSSIYHILQIPDHYTPYDIVEYTKSVLYDMANEYTIDQNEVYNIQVFSTVAQRYVELKDTNKLIIPATINR